LAAPPDHLVHLDRVARPDAPVTQDAGGVVDGDDFGGDVLKRQPLGVGGWGLGCNGPVLNAQSPLPNPPAWKPRLRQAELLGEELQLAVAENAVLFTRLGMVREQQLHDHSPGAPDRLSIRVDDHPLLRSADAGGGEDAAALHVHGADAADGYGVQARTV